MSNRNITEVVRGYKYDGILSIGGTAYNVDEILNAVRKELIAAGYGCNDNKSAHPFHLPPFFRTGSPYGRQVLDLIDRHRIKPVAMLDDMDAAITPHDGKYAPRSDKAAWPKVFGCSFDEEYPNGPQSKQK